MVREPQVAGWNSGGHAAEYNSGKVVYTHVPLLPSSITWYRPMDGDAWRLVTTGLAETNGSLPPGLWLWQGLNAAGSEIRHLHLGIRHLSWEICYLKIHMVWYSRV